MMGMDSFNCTEEEVDKLKTQVELSINVLDSFSLLGKVCRGNCQRHAPLPGWVLKNIPCEGNGIIARDYLADIGARNPKNKRLSILCGVRCPSVATTTSTPTVSDI